MSKQNMEQPILFVGIDWADQEHVACLLDSNNQQQVIEEFKQDPAEIAKWVASLKERFPKHRLLIALEQSRGALMAGLAGFAELELYPINPRQLASYRDALFPSRGKNDPDDAMLLAKFLKEHQQQLRVWQPGDVQTQQIAEFVELRRKLVEERKQAVLRLKSSLKGYFPLLLELSRRDLHNELTLDIIRRWPTLQKLKGEHPKTLRKFLSEHGMKNKEQQTKFIDTVRAATPLTTNKALIDPQSMFAQALVGQLRVLNKSIGEFDEEIQKLSAQHPDEELFRSLPGAGDALVPRLIAAFGSDREKYTSAQQVQNYSGIAPITRQSGKSRHVNKRIACPKFLRQTFHEFADHARKWSPWSKAFYKMKRETGMKHNAAVRALAYKWIRILFRLWQNKELYSEEKYMNQLIKTNSPIIQFLKTQENS
jgi:transposase